MSNELTEDQKARQGEASLEHIGRRFEYPWVIERRTRLRDRASRLSALTGAWGMLTGLALFIAVEGHRDDLLLLGMELLFAVAAAAVIEWLRERATGGEHGAFSWPAVVSSILMLATFEMFVLGMESLATERWDHVSAAIFGAGAEGDAIGSISRADWNLVAFILVWILLAALLSFLLARSMGSVAREESLRLRVGLVAGLRATVVIALVVFASGLLIRLTWAAWVYQAAGYWPFSQENLWQYLLPLGFLAWLASASLGRYGLVAGSVAFGAVLVGRLGIGLHAWTDVTLVSLATALQTALVWGIPAVTLGLFLPLLRRPSNYRWLWSPLAIGVAVVSVALVFEPWAFAVGVVLIGAGLVLRRAERIEGYWPLLAACAAMSAFAATAAVHKATGWGIYRNVQTLINPAPLPPMAVGFRQALQTAEAEADPKVRIAALRALRQAASGEADRPVGETILSSTLQEQLGRNLEERAAFAEALRSPVLRKGLGRYVDERLAFEIAMLGYDPGVGAATPRDGRVGDNTPGLDAPGHAGETATGEMTIDRAHTLELATTGSLTFWITMGLLAAWRSDREET
jgi:hypothetical protein